MRSLIIFALVLVVFASISEARSVQSPEDKSDFKEMNSKEDVKNEALIAKPDSDDIDDKREEEKHSKEEKEKHSKEEEKDKEHGDSKEDREDSREKETDGSYELTGNEFIAIVAILIDPNTHKPHLVARDAGARAQPPLLTKHTG